MVGHATFSIKGKSLVEVLEELREYFEKNPTSTIDSTTLIVNRKAIGDCGIELEIEKAYGKIKRKGFQLILRVSP
ncbi:MAG: hypothetical protein B6U78_03075 [Candidatus Aenigmarchaeota archaeon ex4484_224]|nr:MAG: hypothetical protein B6U78_03075 [Candidatus Aenigmarchaeota archaeon ex4484_224]